MTLKVICFCVLLKMVLAGPQVNVNERIEEIFGSIANTQNRGGFGEIVEPEAVAPTERPQVMHVGQNGETCKCIPYHLCKPDSDRILTTDSRFFPDIDIR